MNRRIAEIATIQVRMMLHLHPKSYGLSI